LGDPIEAQALLATYGQGRPVGRPLWLGSLKSNIGHAQAAAGVGGVIKMVEAMRHGVLPRTLHVDEPSSHVDWSAGDVRLLTEERDWPETGRPRRAGVSSFGVSGTNAHVLLENVPAFEDASEEADAAGEPGGEAAKTVETPALSSAVVPLPLPLLLSAKTERALREQAARLRAHLRERDDVALGDVAHVLATGRSEFAERAVVLASDPAGAVASLGTDEPFAIRGTSARPIRPVFVFPGQGSQWVGMGRELLGVSPVFAEWIGACEEALSAFVEWSLV
ncbi:CurL C-terminal domain-containing protein, partial [Streptomyces sp. 4N509B]|uniref:CurL C-terminal domain-containing protein n=1 Tax=Streptomyces sp. 4N509B TaxID=3457413 RepID=UPI003FD5357A